MPITANLIVKNEELLLPYCLRSIKDWVDEIVIVDTGSTDNTIEIAKGFGARVEQFDWCDDFGRAREFARRQVNTDWLLWLDADDIVLNPEWLPHIVRHCNNNRADAAWSTYEQDGTCHQRRLQMFRTNRYRWKGVVHENPLPTKPHKSKHYVSELHVLHRKPLERCKASAEQYLKILLRKDPDNWLGLAESFRFLGVRHQAEQNYWKAANYPDVNEGTKYYALFWCAKLNLEMAEEASKEGNKSEMFERLKFGAKVAELACGLNPERAEAIVLAGQIATALGHKEEAIECYQEALACIKPSEDIGVVMKLYYSEIPRQLLAKLGVAA
jgi:glycosyltransferase involved in cell wall biosynthesis